MSPEETPKPGVSLSWVEAVRVIPDVAAAEAERCAVALAEAEKTIEDLRKAALYASNARRIALSELREARLQLDNGETERARYYLDKLKRALGDRT